MSMTDLEKSLTDAGLSICPICHMPYKPYHSRQKTCGEPECKRQHKNQYTRELRQAQKSEDINAFRKYHREAQRRYRHKLKREQNAVKNLRETEKYWKDFEDRTEKGADGYNQRQMEKTLAKAGKIDVNMGGKGNDNVHSEDK